MAESRLLLPEGELEAEGRAMHELAARLYPIPRSITGDGVRETLGALRELVPLDVHEVPTGTQVFDWKVPDEWNVREAWIRDPEGRKVVDFAACSLHLVGYSVPVHERMPLARLRERLHTLPGQPDLVPYQTSYYSESWGFCLSHRMLEDLPEGEYEVRIDATLAAGSLSYGELFIPGRSGREVLVSCHVCHPSLANDNLSGIAVTAHLARRLLTAAREAPLRYGYRFLWLPGTIGAITWLATNREAAAGWPTGWWPRIWGIRDPCTTSGAGVATPRSTARSSTCYGPPASPSRSRISFPTATTSASTARPASTSLSAPLPGRPGAATPSTTLRPTTSTSSGRRIWPARSARTSG
jgi:aminopeptidase-like protein